MHKAKIYTAIVENIEQSTPKPTASHKLCKQILTETNTTCLWVYQCMFAMRGVKYKPMNADRVSVKTGLSKRAVEDAMRKLKRANFLFKTRASTPTTQTEVTYLGREAVCLYHVHRLFGSEYASFKSLVFGKGRIKKQAIIDMVMASNLKNKLKGDIVDILLEVKP